MALPIVSDQSIFSTVTNSIPLVTLFDFTGCNTIPTLTCSLWDSTKTTQYAS